MTFLETVLAAAMLAIVAAGFMSITTSINARQQHQLHTLQATELAHGLILQYLDNQTELPAEHLPLRYGESPFLYRWSLTEGELVLEPPPDLEVQPAVRRAERQANARFERLRSVTVNVWLADDSRGGGSYSDSTRVPRASLVRLVDPLSVFRNPDSTRTFGTTPELIENAMGRPRRRGEQPPDDQ